ncbi:DUF547 domain-containing protein [Yeosuana marina]|uniref:DUF547 domain-containing protein n=1 Tax=Yeosuana marina TaxID=1565536 RepID=UPI0014240BB4|nr:DUF547 domain-containing protein [Yeosuana marina]
MKILTIVCFIFLLSSASYSQNTDTIKTFQTHNDSIVTTNGFNQILKKRFLEPHELWDELLQKHVSSNGHVNYKSFKSEHKKLLDYIYVLSLMHKNKAFESLPKEEKLAYWINAYNALTIDLILRNYPVKSIKDIKNPWQQRLWKSVDIKYNLDEIEHNILRKMDKPRIHFAIVCASVSCPKLLNKAYTAKNLEDQLTQATKDFLNDTTKNSISTSNLELSKIFKWFGSDFTKHGSLIDFLNVYSDIQISNDAKIKFKDYNWDLND